MSEGTWRSGPPRREAFRLALGRGGRVWATGVLCVVAVLVGGCSGGPSGTLSALGPSPGSTQSAGSSPGATDFVVDRLQAELETWLGGSDLPGVTAAVATDEGTWAGAAGVDGAGVPLVGQSALGVASVTKTVTAAEVMLLAEQGLVDLDDPVTDYVEVPFDTQGATVRELLGMRSGFPDPTDAVDQAVSADPQRVWAAADWYQLVDEDEPGTAREVGTFRYNNLNYIVLGDLIEAVARDPYAIAVRRDLLDPAGLDRMWVQDAEQPAPPAAVAVNDPDLPLVDADGPWLPSRAFVSAYGAAGGMAADAPSLAAWGLALYAGPLLDPSSVRAMSTASDGLHHYGLGTGVAEDHDGDRFVGHEGGYAYRPVSFLAVWPEDGVSVAVLSPRGADRPLDSLATGSHEVWQAQDREPGRGGR